VANPNGQPKQPWRQVALSYPCETCGAGPGDPCMSVSGRKADMPHVTRTTLASANDWDPPDDAA
jgi:hypothetical protein